MYPLVSADIRIRDPYIVPNREQGKYYMFGTTDSDPWEGKGEGFMVYESEDLQHWSAPRYVFQPAPDFWAEKNFWAPEVHFFRGNWYIFASFFSRSRRRGTQILKSDFLTGPYTPITEGPVTPGDWECLDGTLYVDENGKPWIVFCHEWQQIHNGEICAAPLTEDLTALAAEPVTLFRANEAPWVVSISRDVGDFVTDGPFLYRSSDGKLCMLWSSFSTGDYAIGVAESVTGSVLGPWVQRDKPEVENGGHGMLFEDFSGKTWLSIHSPNGSPMERLKLVPFNK